MHARRGMTGATGNYYVGLDEFNDMALLLHFLRPGDLFIDVGANVGSYTILAAGAIGADVIAFEPGKNARDWLNRNVKLNDVENLVDVHHEAVGSKIGTSAFTKGLDCTNRLVPSEASGPEGEVVDITTLDNVLDGKSPAMLKVDVEGFETEVIRGAVNTLANPALQCVLLELGGAGEQFGYDENDILLKMKEFGFSTCAYEPFTRRLTKGKGATSPTNNTIFVKDMDFVNERLAAAEPFVVKDKSV